MVVDIYRCPVPVSTIRIDHPYLMANLNLENSESSCAAGAAACALACAMAALGKRGRTPHGNTAPDISVHLPDMSVWRLPCWGTQMYCGDCEKTFFTSLCMNASSDFNEVCIFATYTHVKS